MTVFILTYCDYREEEHHETWVGVHRTRAGAAAAAGRLRASGSYGGPLRGGDDWRPGCAAYFDIDEVPLQD